MKKLSFQELVKAIMEREMFTKQGIKEARKKLEKVKQEMHQTIDTNFEALNRKLEKEAEKRGDPKKYKAKSSLYC